MRIDFVKALTEVLIKDTSSVLVTGDLGFNAFEDLAVRLGNRFLNAGIAEQNMIGVSAGMGLSNLKPWVYSIIPFLTMRCLEQIRNDVCFHNLPVRLVGNGGGYTYGIMGSTHHALEDLGILKALPNMTLFFPCANDQVQAAVSQIHQLQSPSYLRLAVSPYATDVRPLSENKTTLTRQYSKGNRGTIIGIGHATQIALHAWVNSPKELDDFDIFSVSQFPFRPALDHALVESVSRTQRLIILDEHYRMGGIGESLLADLPIRGSSVEFMNAIYSLEQKYGSHRFHLKQAGLTPEDLLKKITKRH